MFEALEKELLRREKQIEAKDVYHRDESEEHRAFYNACRNIEFYEWQYVIDNTESEHDRLPDKPTTAAALII
jgi:hypothetical protein